MARHSSLEVDDLRTVVALAEELNFHRVARKVGLSQSGVTRVLAKVERYVGTSLFERSHSKNHSVSPTDAGRFYVERARLALAHSDGAVLAARETLNGMDHRIVVGRSPDADLRLTTILRSMELPLYPRLRVDFQTRLAGELPAGVRAGEFDLAVVTNPTDDAYLTCTPLRKTPFTVVLPEDHTCINGNAVTLKDLASMPWILFDQHIHPPHYDTFRHRAQDLGIGPESIHHIANDEEACEMVREVDGAAFLTPHGAEHAAKDGVVLRLLEETDIFLATQLAVRADNSSKLISEFVRTFVKRLKHAGLHQPDLPKSTIDANCAALGSTQERSHGPASDPCPLLQQSNTESSKAKNRAA
jgi:DNA-binding transcriptional LysR family regulator